MLMSKRDKLHLAAERLNALACPVCGQPMNRAGEDYACAAEHRVNTHRKGCLNVLSTKAETFYDAELFAARRRVFASGCYDAVAEAIDGLLPGESQRVLDAGCGDGWYLNTLLARHPGWTGAGVDISRDAIFQATDQPCAALWCVADLRRLPFRDGAFTVVLDVLTPAGYEEFRRVLAPGGMLVKVYPGSGYLKELRAARGMPPYEEGQVESYLRSRTEVVDERRVIERRTVSPELWRDFVWMTPLNQDLSPEEKEALAARPGREVTIDLHAAVCRLHL